MKCFTINRADKASLEVTSYITIAKSNANYLAVGDTKIMVADNVLDEKKRDNQITSVSVRPEGSRIKLCVPTEYSAKEREALVLFHYSKESWVETTTFAGIEPGQEVAHDAGKKVMLLAMHPGQELTLTRAGKTVTPRQVKLPKDHWWSRQQYKQENDEELKTVVSILLYTGSEFRIFAPAERVDTKIETSPRAGNQQWLRLKELDAVPFTAESIAETIALVETLERKAEFEPDMRSSFLATVQSLADKLAAASHTEAAERVVKLGLRFLYAVPEGFGIIENRKLFKTRLIALQASRPSLPDTTSGALPEAQQK